MSNLKVSNQISGAYFTCCLPLVWINFRQHLHSTNINTSAATLKCQLSPPLIHWGYKGRESYFYDLLNLVAVGQLLNFDTFWDTAHIILVTFPRILPLVIAHRCL